MAHKQDGSGKQIPYVKHMRNAYGDSGKFRWNRGIRRRYRQAIKKSPEEPLFGLKHYGRPC